jgi:hypothetical protein
LAIAANGARTEFIGLKNLDFSCSQVSGTDKQLHSRAQPQAGAISLKAEIWDGPASKTVAVFEFVKSQLTGGKPQSWRKPKDNRRYAGSEEHGTI